MSLPKLSLPLGIVASLLVTAVGAGGSYAALRGADVALDAKAERQELALQAQERKVQALETASARLEAKVDAIREDTRMIKRALIREAPP